MRGGAISLVLNQSMATDNATSGLFASGSNTLVSFAASNVSRNAGNGISQNNASIVRSHGNNAVSSNLLGDVFGTITNVGLI
jgi:hypothetical protein